MRFHGVHQFHVFPYVVCSGGIVNAFGPGMAQALNAKPLPIHRPERIRKREEARQRTLAKRKAEKNQLQALYMLLTFFFFPNIISVTTRKTAHFENLFGLFMYQHIGIHCFEGYKEMLERIDFKKAREDVARFLEDKKELKLIDREVFLKMLSPSI